VGRDERVGQGDKRPQRGASPPGLVVLMTIQHRQSISCRVISQSPAPGRRTGVRLWGDRNGYWVLASALERHGV